MRGCHGGRALRKVQPLSKHFIEAGAAIAAGRQRDGLRQFVSTG